MMGTLSWERIALWVRNNRPAHANVRVGRHNKVVHPDETDLLARDSGLPPGDRGDWRTSFDDGSGLHVQEESDGTFLVHWDHVDPTCGLVCRVEHGVRDGSGSSTIIGALAGAVLGGAAGGWKGAGLGLLAGGGAGTLCAKVTEVPDIETLVGVEQLSSDGAYRLA